MNTAIRDRIVKRIAELERCRDSFERFLDPSCPPPAEWQAIADSEGQPLHAMIPKYIAISERLRQDEIDKLQEWLRNDDASAADPGAQ